MAKPEDKTVLVVDDEEDVREFLADVLEDAGFNVVKAADGEEALEKVKAGRPDFISLDLVMPKRSGMKFLYELRHHEKWANIPVLIVTAHAHDELGRSDLQGIMAGRSLAGPRVYLEKPVEPDTYVRAVCEAMGLQFEGREEHREGPELRREVEKLMQDANADELAEVLELLKRKSVR